MNKLMFLPLTALLPLLMAADSGEGFVRIRPDEIKWTQNASGSSSAVIEGDPQADGLYIQRNKFPPGVFSHPHYHDQNRYVTVIAGTWYTGTGREFDIEKTVPLGPGSYMKHPAGAIHFDGAKDEEVIVEIRGMGPVKTVYLDQ
jgi:hypothetical protein